MPTPVRPQARSAATRATIVKAAEAVFTERGFAAARLKDVADRAGIRRPSIVYYFRDKRDLYEAVLDELFGGLLARIQAAIARPEPVAERIEAVVKAWVAYAGERPSVARLLLREIAEASPARSPAVTRHVEPIIRAVAQILEEGQRRKLLQPIDPVHFIFTVAGATVFFVAATPTLAPNWPFDPLSADQLGMHEAEVLQMTRRWLGIDRLKLAAKRQRQASRRRAE